MGTADESFLDQLIYERVVYLLKRKPNEEIKRRIHAGEEVISRLKESDREIIHDMQEAFTERAAEDEMILYKNGIYDGIRLMKRIREL